LDAFAKGGELISNTLREESIKQSGTLILPMPEKITLTIFYEIDYKAGRGAIKSNLNGFMIAFLKKKMFQDNIYISAISLRIILGLVIFQLRTTWMRDIKLHSTSG
jgi:hypothetical protein